MFRSKVVTRSRVAESGFEARWKKFFGSPPPNEGGPVKNLYTKSERVTVQMRGGYNVKLTVSCRVTLALFERANLYNRQIMILPRETKTYATKSGPGPPSGRPGSGKFYRLSPPPPFVGTD
jgi:hypothetical protein